MDEFITDAKKVCGVPTRITCDQILFYHGVTKHSD